MGERSEGGPQHGAEEQGGGEHPTTSPAPDRHGGGQDLETEKDQRGAQDDLAPGGTFQGVVSDPEEVRVTETECSNAQPSDDGLDPLRNLQSVEAVFKEIKDDDEDDADDGGEGSEDRVEGNLQGALKTVCRDGQVGDVRQEHVGDHRRHHGTDDHH